MAARETSPEQSARSTARSSGFRAPGSGFLTPPRFGILCVLAYVALSWTVRFDMRLGEQIASLVYPLDTFSMYARMPGERSSYLLLRDHHGVVHRVTEFRSFDCGAPIGGSGARCADRRGIQYYFEDLARYIETRLGPGDLDMDLITRTWLVRPGAAPLHESDCIIASCKVSR